MCDIETYPFLKKDDGSSFYDDIPAGWRKKFGRQLCEDIKKIVDRWPPELRDDFKIYSIRMRFGSISILHNGTDPALYNLLDFYDELSYNTCVKCGESSEYESIREMRPYCAKCIANEDERYRKIYDN